MNIEEIREYCLSKPQVIEDFPFDESTLAFKVGGKIFLICGIEAVELSLSLKCDPERAIELRESYVSITPGYHMNKKHWNTVCVYGDVNHKMLLDLINHSYSLVVSGLSKAKRVSLGLV